MFEPIAVFEAFLEIMLRRITLIGLNEILYLVVFLQSPLILRHTLKAIIILWPSLWPKEKTAE